MQEIEMTEEQAKQLGGKYWKGGNDVVRYYFDEETWFGWAGLDVTRYKSSGKVSSATLGGEVISNNKANGYVKGSVYMQDGMLWFGADMDPLITGRIAAAVTAELVQLATLPADETSEQIADTIIEILRDADRQHRSRVARERAARSVAARLGGPVQQGMTVTLTLDEWRDIRDALTHAASTGFPLRDSMGRVAAHLSARLAQETGNPMD
jgi:hypothetical protein